MAPQPTPRPAAPPAVQRIHAPQLQVLAELAFARTVPERVERIRAWPEGDLYVMTVVGTCMVPAGIFHGDTVVIRRQDHATDGQLVAAHYLYGYLDLPWLGLKYYRIAGSRVRLVAADPTVPPIDRDPGQVQVLGVLVAVEGTVTLPPTAPAGCARHGRFLRPGVCGTCQPLAGALGGGGR